MTCFQVERILFNEPEPTALNQEKTRELLKKCCAL